MSPWRAWRTGVPAYPRWARESPRKNVVAVAGEVPLACPSQQHLARNKPDQPVVDFILKTETHIDIAPFAISLSAHGPWDGGRGPMGEKRSIDAKHLSSILAFGRFVSSKNETAKIGSRIVIRPVFDSYPIIQHDFENQLRCAKISNYGSIICILGIINSY